MFKIRKNKKFRKWLDISENWKLLSFWFKIFALIIVCAGLWIGRIIIYDFKEIKADIGKFEKLEVCDDGGCMILTP